MSGRECPACGSGLAANESGHFVPPSLGEEGFFHCERMKAHTPKDFLRLYCEKTGARMNVCGVNEKFNWASVLELVVFHAKLLAKRPSPVPSTPETT